MKNIVPYLVGLGVANINTMFRVITEFTQCFFNCILKPWFYREAETISIIAVI